MMKKLYLSFAAVCCAFAFAACCSVECETAAVDETQKTEAEVEETAEPDLTALPLVYTLAKSYFEPLMGEQGDLESVDVNGADLLCRESFVKYFDPAGKIVFETDSKGIRYARLYGRMNELPFFEWLVTDEGPRPYRYRFILISKNGKKTLSPVETRLITPGDATRFSVKVPADCTAAVLLLDDAE